MLFRLRTPHVIEGAIRNPGTIVGPYGSGAPVVLNTEPTPDMEGADDEGIAEVNKVFNRLHGSDAPWHMPVGEPGRTVPGQPVAPERPYHEDHPDYAEVSDEDRQKADAELLEANQRHWAGHGTTPVTTLPAPGASVTMVRPMTAETPQDQAMRPDRPLAQQLPDTQPGAGASSPAAEAAKSQPASPPPPPTPASRRVTPTKDEDC